MSTQEGRRNNLPPLQKRIVLYLAEKGAQTKNEAVGGLKGQYKSSWIAFKALEKKGLIKKTEVKAYRGREFPRYWLSCAGVFMALVEGASPQELLDKTVRAYPDDEVLQCCLEMAPFTGIEGYRVGLSAILAKGKLEESDATMIMLTQMEKDLSIKQFKQFFELLKKHPAQHEKLKKQVEQLTEFLDKMEKLI